MTPAQQVVVVGAGPAGMMAAARAAERGARVQLLERGPEPGRKLLMTGNGRCNLSNAAPAAQFLHAYGPAGRFLRTALATLDLRALTAWLAAHGIRTVQEDHGRVFPADRRARSVRDALVGALHAAGAELLHGQRVEGLLIEDGRLLGVRTADRVHAAGCVIVATGGLSYPATGSTGDGYELARQAGHAVHAPYAAVTALRTVETWPGRLQGTAARGAAVRTRIDGDATPGRHAGDLMWTHYGVSGPAVLAVSLAVTRALQEGRSVVLEIDLVASTPQDALQADLKRMADSGSRHTVLRVLRERLPERTARVLADVLALDPALPVRHHELLAAACPCPFLIVAGQYDGPASWQYLNAARPVYALHGRAEALGMIDHASGHRPPASAMQTAYQWLAEQFGLPAMAVAI